MRQINGSNGERPAGGSMFAPGAGPQSQHFGAAPQAAYASNKGPYQVVNGGGDGASHSSRWRGQMHQSAVAGGLHDWSANDPSFQHPGSLPPGYVAYQPGAQTPYRSDLSHQMPYRGDLAPHPRQTLNTNGYNPYQPQPGQVMQPGYNPNGQDYETPYTATLRRLWMNKLGNGGF